MTTPDDHGAYSEFLGCTDEEIVRGGPDERSVDVQEATAPDFFPSDRPALADHNRRALARQTATTALGRFQADMLRLMAQYDEARRAERVAAGDDPDEDSDPFELVRQIADSYEALTDANERTEEAVLDDIANSLTLTDIRDLRLAGEAAVAVTRRAIMDELKRKKIPQIATELGLTPSRVYTIVREERRAVVQELIQAGTAADLLAGNSPRAALERYEAALADVPQEHRASAEEFLAVLRTAVEEQESKDRPTK
ncbi:hypothetical protein ACFUGD_06590 [Streptomyces sp. NPDC057217]|uniref:hypothetical protein n=1 Tax=Streptomyces sp. NPDC057217 TaxID=3346054 RepID=UPI0036251718